MRTFLREVATRGTAAIGRGQCIEHYGPGEAYLPVLEAVGRLARTPRGNLLVEWMKQYLPTWLVQMPTLLNPTALQEVQRKVQGATQERMLREMSEGLEVLTEQIPFILVLEDLHWSDVSTLDLLSSLAQRTEPARLLIIGTYRPADVLTVKHPLSGVVQELQVHRQCHSLILPTLPLSVVSMYLETRFPRSLLPTRFAQELYAHTEGNPLFLVAILDDLVAHNVLIMIDGSWSLQVAIEEIRAIIPRLSHRNPT